jgi:hypothetical protein
MQKLAVTVILSDSLTQVAFSGVNANEYAVGTFPKRFRPDRCERRFDRFAVLAGCQQVLSERLQGM